MINNTINVCCAICLLSLIIACSNKKSNGINKTFVDSTAACTDMPPLPPPHPPGEIFSSDTLQVTINKIKYPFIAQLSSEKMIDMSGEGIEIFKIFAKNTITENELTFALPLQFSNYRNKIELKKDSEKDRFKVGFYSDKTFHSFYTVQIDSNAWVRIDSISWAKAYIKIEHFEELLSN